MTGDLQVLDYRLGLLCIKIQHYYRSGDHAPPHLHVTGGGLETRIGQNGRPLEGDAELAPVQQRVVEANIGRIRRTVRKIGRYHWFNEQ